MKNFFTYFLFFCLPLIAYTQTDTITSEVNELDVMPTFPGGQDALSVFLFENLTYPTLAKEQDIQGKVWIGFIVDKDGTIKDVEVLRGIGGGCDEEAKRVIEKMPNWTPGTREGKPVIVKFRFPINFILRENTTPTKKKKKK